MQKSKVLVEAIGIGTIGIVFNIGCHILCCNCTWIEFMDALFISAALSISSTAIIVKIFEETGTNQKRIFYSCFRYFDC